jgi:serine/threonine-protein kinase
MLPAHVAASRGTLAALQRDFARLRALDHPHIARLVELGCNGQQYYVTGERLDGEPLREVLTHLAPEHLDVGEADDLVRAIGSALVYAHEHGIAHGDVRAENVFVTMDRRFVLTNFLARRVAKVSGRPPRSADDLKGLARLAAELYTGSTSPNALRSAAHGAVPAARLNAIRAVLEGSGRRAGSVAEFLAAAGLAFADDGVAAALPRATAAAPRRSWSIWRLVLPMAAVAAVATFLASYHGGVGASAEELKVRGLDAWRAVAARVTPPTPAGDDDAPHVADAPAAAPAAAPSGPTPPEPGDEPAHAAASPAEPQPAAVTTPTTLPTATRARATGAASATQRDPAVLSLGVPRIAAREDHSVIAIDVVRSGDTTHEASVGWWTTPDTAHADDDYANLGRQTLTFPAGATVERVLIPIVNDGLRESSEAFTVHLSRPHGGVTGAVTTTRVTVYDDD